MFSSGIATEARREDRMSTLVIAEHNNRQMLPATRHTLAAALALGPNPVLLVVGYQCESVANEAAAIEGVKEVWWADHACYEGQLAENLSQFIAELAPSFETIMAPATTFGKDLLPRVAALLNVAQVSDVTRIIDSMTFEHPIYAGNAVETVKLLDPIKCLTVRTTAFPRIEAKQSPCPMERIEKVFEAKKTRLVKRELSPFERPRLENAKIVVSGGRGLQSAEAFKLVEELADMLGAAIGASRAAVDAGFAPNDYQVGQTGKVVAPSLYIALGISGAVQHLAGMKDSKVIVAINKDENAPIFQIATYGLVGDLFKLVPELMAQLKEL